MSLDLGQTHTTCDMVTLDLLDLNSLTFLVVIGESKIIIQNTQKRHPFKILSENVQFTQKSTQTKILKKKHVKYKLQYM